MSVLVYNGEKFHRNKLWYLIFAVVFASVFVLSLLNNNLIGAILIFFLLGGYFYYSTINNQVIKMTITDTQLLVGNKTYPRSFFIGYVVEIYPKTQQIKNIVLLTPRGHIIYSFDDSIEQVRGFLSQMDSHLPMLADFHQTTLEKFSRKIQL